MLWNFAVVLKVWSRSPEAFQDSFREPEGQNYFYNNTKALYVYFTHSLQWTEFTDTVSVQLTLKKL